MTFALTLRASFRFIVPLYLCIPSDRRTDKQVSSACEVGQYRRNELYNKSTPMLAAFDNILHYNIFGRFCLPYMTNCMGKIDEMRIGFHR